MSIEMQIGEMRERARYALPDGRQLIAHGAGRDGFFKLYDPLIWDCEGPDL